MIKIYDDILEVSESDHIEKCLKDPRFPWFFVDTEFASTVLPEYSLLDSDINTQETTLLGHSFYLDGKQESINYKISDFILDRFIGRSGISFNSLVRSKANLQFKSAELNRSNYTTPHVDSLTPHHVLIYYVNNSDGNTVIFDRVLGQDKTEYKIIKEIEPKKGRFLLFDGKHYHAAKFALINNVRININFNITCT
jgi:hypothetical protein